MNIADRLKAERERLGLTQREIAIKTGITERSQVSYENGRTTPNGDYLAIVAKLGIDIQYVITGIRNVETNKTQKIEDRKMIDALKFLRNEIDLMIQQMRGEQ